MAELPPDTPSKLGLKIRRQGRDLVSESSNDNQQHSADGRETPPDPEREDSDSSINSDEL